VTAVNVGVRVVDTKILLSRDGRSYNRMETSLTHCVIYMGRLGYS